MLHLADFLWENNTQLVIYEKEKQAETLMKIYKEYLEISFGFLAPKIKMIISSFHVCLFILTSE